MNDDPAGDPTVEFRRVSITELRNHRAIDEIVETDTAVTITYHSKPVAVLSTFEYFDSRFIDRLAAAMSGRPEKGSAATDE